MKIKYLICFLASLLLCFLIYWSLNDKKTASWTGTICYFVLAYLLLNAYDDGKHTIPIASCIILGRMLPAITLLFIDFRPMRFMLFTPLLSSVAVALAGTYFRNKEGVVLILSMIIMVLFNSLGPEGWEQVAG